MAGKVKARLLPGVAVGLVFIVANALVSFWSVRTITDNSRRVIHSQDVIEQTLATLSAMKSAETSQRGYLLTGDDVFFQRYRQHIENVHEHLDRLEGLAEDAFQADRINRLRQFIGERNQTLEHNAAIRRTQGLDDLLRTNTLYLGKDQMDRVLALMDEIEQDEHRLLTQHTEELTRSSRNITVTLLAANFLGLGLLLSAYFLTNRYLEERARSEAQLQEANDNLEVRVKERTLELNDANTELERSNRELQDFAFVASHDLQEPLRKIQAFGDRLRSKHGAGLNAEAQDYLDRMQNAARRMHTLINDLLTFSRVTTKAQPFVKTDLGAIARDVLGDLEERVQQTSGRVDVGELPTVEADPLQMRQLFQNLIGNALKFHRPGVQPIIKVNSKSSSVGGNGSHADGHCQIIVEDNGIGFDEKYLDRIFTPFQRLHGRGEYEGTGIGLAVCRKIVERHGGTLTAKSRPGEGSTFIVTLPVEQD